MKVTPKGNVLDQANAQNDTLFNNSGDGLVHTCIDRDGVAPSSTAVISRYPSYKKYDIKKPFTRSYSIRYPTGVWLDCQSPSTFSMKKELGLSGGITLYAEDILEDSGEVWNEPWAQVQVQYNIVFQGKTSNSLTGVYDMSGALVGMTINAVDLTATQRNLTIATNVRGTLGLDTRTVSDTVEESIPDTGIPLVA